MVGLEAANGNLTVPVPTQGSLIMVRCKVTNTVNLSFFFAVYGYLGPEEQHPTSQGFRPFLAYRSQILTRKNVTDKMRLCPDLIDVCTSH